MNCTSSVWSWSLSLCIKPLVEVAFSLKLTWFACRFSSHTDQFVEQPLQHYDTRKLCAISQALNRYRKACQRGRRAQTDGCCYLALP